MKTLRYDSPNMKKTAATHSVLAIWIIITLFTNSCTKEPGFGGKYGFSGTIVWPDLVQGQTNIPAANAQLKFGIEGTTFVYETVASVDGKFAIDGISLAGKDSLKLIASASRVEAGHTIQYAETSFFIVDPHKLDPDPYEIDPIVLKALPQVSQNRIEGTIYFDSPSGTASQPASSMSLQVT